MDLNQLFQREGEERLRAAQAASPKARAAHLGLADMFRERIDFRRRALLNDTGLGPQLRPPAL